ncbi:MAG: hypothetical protein A3F90_00695 [Deltaproteobacteria bacterium RIFCSPLOWO2_12_FULL_60_19]|nr:MAG: hypothetical protein A3F90_00695 [Deltaproteobacteria bacterium RIFCSPLOWO2_12_FULL_60_19]
MRRTTFLLILAAFSFGTTAYATEMAIPPAGPPVARGPSISRPPLTFTVPVRLSNVRPEVTEGAVRCFALKGPAGGGQVGSGTTRFSIPSDSGGFSGNVVVNVAEAFGTPGQDDLSLATHYRCELLLNDPGKGLVNPET